MKPLASALLLTTALAVVAGPAVGQSQGDWTVGLGFANINPKSSNGPIAGVGATIDDSTRPIFTVEYFIRDNWGVELLASTPFAHNVTLAGIGDANARQLPPTLSLNYHFPTEGKIKPFIGAGLNYTTFFEESTALGKLKLDDSIGLALQIGADYQISPADALRFNVRWIDIDADATLDGADIGTAEIDPVIVGLSYVHRF